MAQVMIVGAGPTGLMLACDLRRAGVSVQLVDRAHRRLVASRGAALHPRTMELFDQRGIVDEFLAAGRPIFGGPFRRYTRRLVDAPHSVSLPLRCSSERHRGHPRALCPSTGRGRAVVRRGNRPAAPQRRCHRRRAGPLGSSTSVWSTWSAATARTARYADSPASRSMGPTGVWSLCWVTWNWRTHREIG
jgi:hypothetical protein